MQKVNQQHDIFSGYKLVDLTHALNSQVPTWNDSCGFEKLSTVGYSECASPTKFRIERLKMHAGIGTHMDAPSHCIEGGVSIAAISLKQLMLPLVVLDVSSKAHAGYEINTSDIVTFEKTHGLIPSGSLVVGYTGWSKYWDDPIKYRNPDEKGLLRFPSFNYSAAEVLLSRGISGIAIDTLSPDLGVNGHFPVHELFLGAGKYLIENVANAHLLPPIGAYGIVLPLKIAEGSEAPLRFVALV